MAEIKVRPAIVSDATIIAQAVAMAIGDETVVKYCGADYLKALEASASAEFDRWCPG